MARDRYDDDDEPRGRRRRDDDYDEPRRRDDDYEDDYDDRPRGAPPPNYLVPSILATLCCCLPAGVAAIVFAAQVNSKWAAGDYAGARRASENAKQWAWISFGLGIVGGVISFIINFMAAMQAGKGP
jgi:hypothetical protein